MKKVIQYNNAALAYYVYGDGPVVMLLHGFAETSAVWKNQVSFLSECFRVILPDLPGSGNSEMFSSKGSHLSIDELADSIHSILVNENIDKLVLLGHSMGGYVTLAFAEKYAEKLKAFGLVNSTAFADSDEKKQNRLRGIDIMEDYGGYAFIKNTTPNLFSEAFKANNAEVVNELIEEGRQFETKNLQQYYFAMMERTDKTQLLKNNKFSVLFVMGTEDVAAPLSDVLKQATFCEIAYIHIITGTGHMSMLEKPDELNRILKNFVNDAE